MHRQKDLCGDMPGTQETKRLFLVLYLIPNPLLISHASLSRIVDGPLGRVKEHVYRETKTSKARKQKSVTLNVAILRETSRGRAILVVPIPIIRLQIKWSRKVQFTIWLLALEEFHNVNILRSKNLSRY